MALFTVWFLLLLLHATTHAQLCPEGHYCPAGADCSSDRNLCIAGVCKATAEGTCEQEVLVEFESPSYEIIEGDGAVRLAVVLDGPLDCCSIAVTVRVDDGTAIRYQDYSLLSPDPEYVTLRFRAGETRATFVVSITDDDQLEDMESFSATIFDLSVPYGVTLGSLDSATVSIVDDDSTTLSFSRLTFYADENDGHALPELALSVPAPFDIDVYISSFNNHLSDQCDEFSTVKPSYEVKIPKGTTRKEFPVNITDDDVYEGDESFTLAIDNSLPSRVNLGQPDMAEIVIVDDEDLITASFEHPLYKVTEHQGSIEPRLVLSKPSPCCFILHTQVMESTAEGGYVDFGSTSKVYLYTFHAGSTCASPNDSISIIDDKMEENIEHFTIRLVAHTLPFGVKAGPPTVISIIDNDNVVYFKHGEHSVREDNVNGVTIELLLAEPARSDRRIYVYSQRSGDTAKAGSDFKSGPYYVDFKKDSTSKYFTIPTIDDNSYEGEEYFTIYISNLPHGVVLGYPNTAKVTIEDDEYAVCFEKQKYSIEEGGRVKIDLTLTRTLPKSLTVNLVYSEIGSTSSSDYYASPRSVTFRAGTTAASISVSTREDYELEQDESFKVAVSHSSLPTNTGCDYAVITIKDDDEHKCKFERSEYRSTKRSPAKPRLVINKTPEFSFSIHVREVDGTAKGGKDYKTNRYIVRFEKGGSRYGELTTTKIDDNYVEDDEYYYLEIITELLPEDVVIDGHDTTKIILVNEDVTTVTRSNEVLNFSIPLSFDVEVTASYYSGISDQNKVLTAGQKQLNFDSLTINQLQRITITVPCGLQRNDFIIRTSRVYVTGPSSTCPP